MRKTEEMYKELGVDDLITLKEKDAALYEAFLHLCMNRGYAEIKRVANRLLSHNDNRQVMLNRTLDSAANAKLAKLVTRMANSTMTATDMYQMFRACDAIGLGRVTPKETFDDVQRDAE